MKTIHAGYLCGLLAFCLFAGVTSAQTSADYHVVFDGIVMHYFPQSGELPNARALIIQGNSVTLRHKPILITPRAIDVAALRDATGQPVFCDKVHCRVKISGYDIRIGTEDKQPAPNSLTPSAPFVDFVPHMQRVTKGKIIDTVINDLPGAPVAGFFELLGVSLSANKFDDTAFFYPDHDQEGDRYFADRVTLDGAVAPGSAACIQIRSDLTWPSWQVIKHTVAEPLEVTVVNRGTQMQSNGDPVHSSRHFALYKKLIATALDFPHVCPSDGNGDDDACPRKVAPKVAGEIALTEAMAGCANTQWP